MPQRVVVIGDIGVTDEMIHIGDEAMFEAMLTELRRRGISDIIGISSAPAESRQRYSISAVAPIGWPMGRTERLTRMATVVSAVSEPAALAADDPALGVIDAIRKSDGVAIAGGGNMSSLWPHHIFERATIGAIAVALGKPLVVSGQTIGPELDHDDSALVRDLLGCARLVGLRESSSLALCEELGVPSLTQTIDDASYLATSAAPGKSDYCLVSIASHIAGADRTAVVTAIAALLDHLAHETGLEIVFLPHFGALSGPSRGDCVMHDAIIAAMSTPARSVAPTDSIAAAELARHAAIVVSSRYHPVVFAVPAWVPTIGIPVDDYTGVKLRGALGNFGQNAVLPVAVLLAGGGPALATQLWADREAIRNAADALDPVARARSSAWWDRVAAALGAGA